MSDAYREILPLLNMRTLVLLDHPRLIDQIAKLERRTGRLGKDTITHRARVAHDDAVSRTSCALLALAAIHQRGSPCAMLIWSEAH
jgi:hypothetical protein